MRTASWLALGVMSLGLPAQAGEEPDLSMRSHALAANKSLEAPHASAPFVKAQDPAEHMPFSVANEATPQPTPCAAQIVCYDARQGNLVYRGARDYMPRIRGLAPEGVALRHDRLILRYSFK